MIHVNIQQRRRKTSKTIIILFLFLISNSACKKAESIENEFNIENTINVENEIKDETVLNTKPEASEVTDEWLNKEKLPEIKKLYTENNPANIGDIIQFYKYVPSEDILGVSRVRINKVCHDYNIISKYLKYGNNVAELSDNEEFAIAVIEYQNEKPSTKRIPAFVSISEKIEPIYNVTPNKKGTTKNGRTYKAYLLYKLPHTKVEYLIGFGDDIDNITYIKGE